jgi:molybdate transport system substrate-binding protein
LPTRRRAGRQIRQGGAGEARRLVVGRRQAGARKTCARRCSSSRARKSPLGIVYQTAAAADKGVKIVAVLPEDTHPPVVYPIALTAGSKSPGAATFLGFLHSAAAKPIFEKQGLTVLP